MKRKQLRVASGGFTLIEAAIATVIVGVGVGVLLTGVAACTRVNSAGKELTQGVFLAQEVREWTLQLPFSDPDPGDQGSPPGPDGSDPQVFVDDLDDLMDVTYSPPRDARGHALDDMPDWSETLTLTWRDPDSLTAVVPPGASDVLYVEVEIRNQARPVVTTGWLVTRRE
jgi:type II secretory pathway pseudopilin PulG